MQRWKNSHRFTEVFISWFSTRSLLGTYKVHAPLKLKSYKQINSNINSVRRWHTDLSSLTDKLKLCSKPLQILTTLLVPGVVCPISAVTPSCKRACRTCRCAKFRKTETPSQVCRGDLGCDRNGIEINDRLLADWIVWNSF